MKRGVKIQAVFLLICLFLPCAFVLFLGMEGKNNKHIYNDDYIVLVGKEAVDSEKFLIWALAAYAEPENEIESLKAIAVILRTNLRKAMAGKNKISAEELGFIYYTEKELEEIWGEQAFVDNYRKLEKAVFDTESAVILNQKGEYIDALFHRVSAGYTREGVYLGEEYSYLCPAESLKDINATNYMQLVIYNEETVKKLLEEYLGENFEAGVKPFAQEIVLQNEDGNYVEKVTVCGQEFSADEIAAALKLQSPAFVIEEYEGKIRFLVSGIGHGFGLSIYGSNALAGEGYGFKDILEHYYTNIIIKYE